MPGRVGVNSYLDLGDHRKPSFLIVYRPIMIIGRDYFEEFLIQFISPFMRFWPSAYSKKTMSEPPLKKMQTSSTSYKTSNMSHTFGCIELLDHACV